MCCDSHSEQELEVEEVCQAMPEVKAREEALEWRCFGCEDIYENCPSISWFKGLNSIH